MLSMASGAGGGSNSLDMSSAATAGNIGATNIGGLNFNNGGSSSGISTGKALLFAGAVVVFLLIFKKKGK